MLDLSEERTFWAASGKFMDEEFAANNGRIIRVVAAEQDYYGGRPMVGIVVFERDSGRIMQKAFFAGAGRELKITRRNGGVQIRTRKGELLMALFVDYSRVSRTPRF